MRSWRPHYGDWFEVTPETCRTRYIKAKSARLLGQKLDGIERVIFRDLHPLTTATTKVFTVRGDTDPRHPYTCHVRPFCMPWMAACSRGGVHDLQREGEACAHGLAAATKWWRLSATPEEVAAALIEARRMAMEGASA
jgi:hypothetical protein